MIEASISPSLLKIIDKRIKNKHSKHDIFPKSLFEYCKNIIEYEAVICKEEIITDMVCKTKKEAIEKMKHLRGQYIKDTLPFITLLVEKDLVNIVEYILPHVLACYELKDYAEEWVSTLAFITFAQKDRMVLLKQIHKYHDQWMKYSNITFFSTHIDAFKESDMCIVYDIFIYRNYALREKMSLDDIHNFHYPSVLKAMAERDLLLIDGKENPVRIFARASIPIISVLHDYTSLLFQGCEAVALNSNCFIKVAFLIDKRLFRMKKRLIRAALLSDNADIVRMFYNQPNCKQWIESIIEEELGKGNISLLFMLEEIDPERDFSAYVALHEESDADKALIDLFRNINTDVIV